MLPLKSYMVLGVIALAGCASVSLPVEVANVTLVKVPSAAVEVHRPKFRVKDGELSLEGYVFRQHTAETTADSHIDIVFLDVAGRTLRVDTTSFSPRSLSRSFRPPQPHAYFLVPVPQVPAGTVAIEVRGHDGRHD